MVRLLSCDIRNLLFGNNIDIPIPHYMVPVESKILPYQTLDPVSRYRRPHFLRYGDANSRSAELIRGINGDKQFVLDPLPGLRQREKFTPF